MDTALTIESLVGFGVKYGGCTEFNTKEEFDKLRWNDVRAKPTWLELTARWDQIKDIPEPKTEIEIMQEEIEDLKSRLTIQEAK